MIEHLIEAHRNAWRQFEDYCDVHEAAHDAYKPERALVPIYLTPDGRKPGGYYELNPDHPESALKASPASPSRGFGSESCRHRHPHRSTV